jgi:hypothetical protein
VRLSLVVLVAGVAVAALAAPSAQAQALPACPDMPPDLVSATDDAIETREQGQRDVTICLAVTARLDRLVTLQEEAVDSETTTAAQRVALAPVDRNRLDLTWWGVWALVGTTFGLFAGSHLLRAFRFWRE